LLFKAFSIGVFLLTVFHDLLTSSKLQGKLYRPIYNAYKKLSYRKQMTR